MGVRLAKKEDLDEILEVERRSFQNPWDYSYFNAALNDILLVYEDDKTRRVVGYLIAVCCKRNRAVIMKVAVHPEYRNRGIASRLLKEVLELLRGMGIKEVEIDVDMINEDAINLYKKVGFKISRTIPMNSEDESFYTMKLELLR